MWLALAFASAFLLGCYEVNKKISLNGNAVIPVLFLNTLISSLIFVPFIFLSFCTNVLDDTMFYVPRVSFYQSGDRVVFLDIRLFCIEASAAYHHGTDQGYTTGPYFGRSDGYFWGTSEFVSVDRGFAFHRFILYAFLFGKERRDKLYP